MYFYIDRFEGDFAICEDENLKIVKIARKKIKSPANEGDILKFYNNFYIVDFDKTLEKKTKNYKIQEKIFH